MKSRRDIHKIAEFLVKQMLVLQTYVMAYGIRINLLTPQRTGIEILTPMFNKRKMD